MTRRDEFIRAALGGIMANNAVAVDGVDSAAIAKFVCEVVDDVIAADECHPRETNAECHPRETFGTLGDVSHGTHVGLSDAELALSGLKTLAGEHWSNPLWAKDVAEAVRDMLDHESAPEIRREARRLLSGMEPDRWDSHMKQDVATASR